MPFLTLFAPLQESSTYENEAWHVRYRLVKDECPVDALRACVFIYLPYILKNNVEFRRK